MLTDTFKNAWQRASGGPLPLQADEEEPVDVGAITDKGIELVDVLRAHVAKTMNGHVVEDVEVPFVAALHDPDSGALLDEALVGSLISNRARSSFGLTRMRVVRFARECATLAPVQNWTDSFWEAAQWAGQSF